VNSTGSEPAAGDAPAVWLLALGQTLGFACLLYSFGALLVPVGQETGWSKPDLALGLTLALVVAALLSPLAGRLIDRGYGAELLWGGAALGGLALMVVASAEGLVRWYLGWALIGPSMAASLYDACFSFLTRRLGPVAARPAIIRVTLVAGLASTLAFPLGAVMAAQWGWRGAFAGFGALDLMLAAPLMAYAGVRLRRRDRAAAERRAEPPGRLRAALRRPPFWLLTAAFGAAWMNHSILVTYFIPLFTGLGAGPAMAVAAASTVGPFQVIGRVILMLLGARAPALLATRTAFGLMAAASLILLAAGAELRLIFVFAVLEGAAIGILSILRPVLTAEVMGAEGFGAISGAISIGPLLATAAAPLLGAGLIGLGGPMALVAGSLGIAGVGLGLVLILRAGRGSR
jgi:predicted MFS family arabinose efflux permease